MQRSDHEGAAVGKAFSSPKFDFKIFIASEDHGALGRALRVADKIELMREKDMRVSRLIWSFALLRHDALRAAAAREAAGAAMIIMALDAEAGLPAHVKRWIENWPIRAKWGETALVTLVGGEAPTGGRFASQFRYLEWMARSRRLDFICNVALGDGHALRLASGSVDHSRAEAPTDEFEQLLPWRGK